MMKGAEARYYADYRSALEGEERKLKDRVHYRERLFRTKMLAFRGTSGERREKVQRHEKRIEKYQASERRDINARVQPLKERYLKEREARRKAEKGKRTKEPGGSHSRRQTKPTSAKPASNSRSSQSSRNPLDDLLGSIEEVYRRIKEDQQRKLEQTRKEMEEKKRKQELKEKEREQRRIDARFITYENGWLAIVKRQGPLRFVDIPWPVLSEPVGPQVVTKEAVYAFFNHAKFGEQKHLESPQKCMRAELLRWHTDKFNASVLQRAREEDREVVEELGEMVVRVLTDLKERK